MGIIEAARRRPFLASISAYARTRDMAIVLEVAKLVVVARIVFFIVGYASSWLLATDTVGASQLGFLDMWNRWDVTHFVNIAENGYFGAETAPNATAFFPLLPLAIATLSVTGLPFMASGLLIAFVATVVACFFLYKLADAELGEGSGRKAVLYLLLFPTAVFLVAPYSESLFLAGAIPAFYFARRQRWLAAGPWAAVAMAARLAGVFVLIGLTVEFIRQKKFNSARIMDFVTSMMLGSLPLLAYALYLQLTVGKPLQFVIAQKEGWGREFVGPVRAFLNTWNTWEGSYFTNWMFAWRLEILAAIVGLALVIWALLKKEWSYAAYMGSGLVLLVNSSWYYSIPRMLLTWFPVTIFLVQYSRQKPGRHEIVLLAMAPIAALGVILFTRDIWFF